MKNETCAKNARACMGKNVRIACSVVHLEVTQVVAEAWMADILLHWQV